MATERVYKYKLGGGRILMPRGAKVLGAGVQGGGVCVWALVNHDNEHCDRCVFVVPTGVPLPTEAEGRNICHIGTVVVHDPDMGDLVFHAFDGGELEQPADHSEKAAA